MADPLRDILDHAAEAPDLIYVEGGIVRNRPTIPLQSVEALANFAAAAWKRCVRYEAARFKIDHALSRAEVTLERLAERGLDKDVSIALLAVQSAREQL